MRNRNTIEFTSWISIEFRLYIVMEFRHLKAKEQEQIGH